MQRYCDAKLAPHRRQGEGHGHDDDRRSVGVEFGGNWGRADLGRHRRQPERPQRQPAPARQDRLDACPPRRGRRLRGRRRGGGHRAARGLRRELRAGQSASDQWPLRLSPQPCPGAGDRGAHPLLRDRPLLFPGDPPAGTLQGMQPLRGAGLHTGADAARAGDRAAHCRRQARRRGHRAPRRCRAEARARRRPADPLGAGGNAAAAAGRGRTRPSRRHAERQCRSDPTLRQRLRRRA